MDLETEDRGNASPDVERRSFDPRRWWKSRRVRQALMALAVGVQAAAALDQLWINR